MVGPTDPLVFLLQTTHSSFHAAALRLTVSGHAKLLRHVRITQNATAIGGGALKHQKGMKEAWCIVTNWPELGAAEIVSRYGRRFTIEETFRDLNDNPFGMGMPATNLSSADRRDLLLFSSASPRCRKARSHNLALPERRAGRLAFSSRRLSKRERCRSSIKVATGTAHFRTCVTNASSPS